jgi:hypothetical protein
MSYKKDLKDKRWFNFANEVKKRDGYKCRICNSNKNLHVHHLYYLPKLKPWEYDKEAVVTVCDLHHELLTFELPKLSGIIAFEILTKQFEL